ncbi:MAG: hypothetical protein HZA16_03885 [Nitrospirae bacterium]|nr:hypothetical protein [Nitrospirota bacterium]
MPLILRVDVDKPYGRANLREKVLSKIREDYWLPAISSLRYLEHVRKFLVFLADMDIKAHIYFRRCTLPPRDWINSEMLNGHLIGYHAEDTRTLETFKKELELVQSYLFPVKVSSFNKHGSGKQKLGRHHYPDYEPHKYREWGKITGVPFYFGNNELVKRSATLSAENGYYPGMFWLDRRRSDNEQLTPQEVVEEAKRNNVVVIIHPANFFADKQVEGNMRRLLSAASDNNVPWTIINDPGLEAFNDALQRPARPEPDYSQIS